MTAPRLAHHEGSEGRVAADEGEAPRAGPPARQPAQHGPCAGRARLQTWDAFQRAHRSAFSGRDSRPPMAASTSTPARSADTASQIGVSTPSLRGQRAHRRAPRRRPRPPRACRPAPPPASGPRPSARPTLMLRDCGLEQVSTRSPRPQRPATVSASAAQRHGQAGHLGEAAGDQGGVGAAAQAPALDDAAGDGQHVLHRPAGLGADHVGRRGRAGRSGVAMASASSAAAGRRRGRPG